MSSRALTVPLLSLGLAAGALAGCGSSTSTVSASSPPSTGTSASSTSTTPPSTTTTSPPATTTTQSTGATRTATAPAFTKEEGGSEATSAAAVALVRSKGYTPNDPGEYHDSQTLRVLVATRTGSGDGYGQQAFFFADGHYLGTDAKEASAKVKVVSQADTEVTLAYPLYRHNDPLSTPSGGQTTVRFALDNGKLTALGKIPPVSSTSGYSRY